MAKNPSEQEENLSKKKNHFIVSNKPGMAGFGTRCKKLRGLLLLLSQTHDEHPGFKLCDRVPKLQGSLHRAGLVFVWRVRDSWTRRSHFLEQMREVTPARRLRDQRGAAEILKTLKL